MLLIAPVLGSANILHGLSYDALQHLQDINSLTSRSMVCTRHLDLAIFINKCTTHLPCGYSASCAVTRGNVQTDESTHLQRTSQQMAIVWKTCRERRSVVEDVRLFALAPLELLLERIGLVPELKNLLFLLWEAVILTLNDVLHAD